MTDEKKPWEGQLDRFWPRVDKREDGCWLWLGALNEGGYGQAPWNGAKAMIHRIFFEVLREPIPPPMVLDHLCRVRNCVNPDHLEIVTHRENTLRGIGRTAINARKKKCHLGHDFDPTLRYGKRWCRICSRAKDAVKHRRWRKARRILEAK